MQIRKCVLIEMFSLVLIGMFSPFFHIIGSRIGAFGLFPFGNVSCVSSIHTSVRAHGRLRRAGGAAWMDPSRENFAAHARPHRPQTARREPGTNPAAAAQPRTRRGAATAAGRPAAEQAPPRGTAACPVAPRVRDRDCLRPPAPAAPAAPTASAQTGRGGSDGGAGNERG